MVGGGMTGHDRHKNRPTANRQNYDKSQNAKTQNKKFRVGPVPVSRFGLTKNGLPGDGRERALNQLIVQMLRGEIATNDDPQKTRIDFFARV